MNSMDQTDIDALLQELDDLQHGVETPVHTSAVVSSRGPAVKRFKRKNDKNQRITFPYHSPVVKRETFCLNPVHTAILPDDCPVVRTLAHYREYCLTRQKGSA